MTKPTAVTDGTRRVIMDAFWELYKTQPIEKIRISEITLRAQVHRSTFYRYFYDIFDLLEQIEEEELQSISSELREAVKTKEDFEHYLPIEHLQQLLISHTEKIYYLIGAHNKFKKQLEMILRPVGLSMIKESVPEAQASYIYSFIFSLFTSNVCYLYENRDLNPLKDILTFSESIIRNGIIDYTIWK